MGAIVNLQVLPGTSSGASFLSAADVTSIDLYNLGLLTEVTEAKFCDVDASGYVTGTTSNLPVFGGSTLQTMAPAASARAPLKYNTTDGQFGIRSGYNADGSSNATRSTLRSTNMPVPTGSWSASVLAKWDLPAALSYLWAVNDPTLRFGLACTNTGVIRLYQNITAGTFAVSAAGVNDGNLHLWTVEWDGTTATVYKDGVAVITSTTAMAAATDRAFRTFSYNSGASDATAPGGQGAGYWEFHALGKPSASVRAYLKAKALSYHPSLTIA